MSTQLPGAGAIAAAPADTENTEQHGSAAPQVPRFFFDVLPLHPRPRPWETLTSYVARLARANGIGSVGTLWTAIFPTMPKKYVQRLADHEPPDLGPVAALGACSEALVRATTFAHVGEKFGRVQGPYEAQRFLGPSLAPSPRYCPECLAEDCYYRLPWRFTALPGCPEHGRVLLDRCGHCGRSLPFLKSPFALGECAACRGDLRLCTADELDASGIAVATRVQRQLLFLLAPLPAPPDGRRGDDRVADHLIAARRAAGLTRRDAAAHFGIAEHRLRGMERPKQRVSTKGPVLRTYLQYADRLGLALSACFAPLPAPVTSGEPPPAGRPGKDNQHQQIYQGPAEQEARLVTRARNCLEVREARGESLTITAVAAELGLSRRGLDYYPAVRRVLDEVRERQGTPAHRQRRRARREAALLAAVERERAILAWGGSDLDAKAIGKLLGASPATVREFASVQQLIARITGSDEAT